MFGVSSRLDSQRHSRMRGAVAISWTASQRNKVSKALAQHPILSLECFQAARKVRVVAVQHDAAAAGHKITPVEGYYLDTTPHVPLPDTEYPWWRHHYTIKLLGHFVDALTDVPGELEAAYISKFFRTADHIDVRPHTLERED